MSQKIQKSRLLAFERQNGRCYYCNAPVWLEKIAEFAAKFGISLRQATQLQCTAEHLVARHDGGSDSSENIVAACWFCNSRRHRRKSVPSPRAFRKFVSKRIKQFKWHPKQLHNMLEI